MNEPELTEAVDVAARAAYESREAPSKWDDVPPMLKWRLRQAALAYIAPAAQLIYDQGVNKGLEMSAAIDELVKIDIDGCPDA